MRGLSGGTLGDARPDSPFGSPTVRPQRSARIRRLRRVVLAGLAAAVPLASCVQSGGVPEDAGVPAPAAVAPAPCTPAPLGERAAAVLVAGMPETLTPADPLATTLPRMGVGGILLTQRNVRSEGQVQALTAALRQRAPGPVLITTDEEGGQVSSFRPILGRSDSAFSIGGEDPDVLFARGRILGAYLRHLGLNGDLAPVADVTVGDASTIGSRSFSSDPATATTGVLAFSRGLTDGGSVPTVKHFPGLGRSTDDTHAEVAVVPTPRAELEREDLAPFSAAIRAGVPVVMLSHAAYPALGISGGPASLSPAAYALLRSMGFTGVAMTDSLGMGAVNLRFDYPEAGVRALVAGADALLFTDGNQAQRMRDAIVAAVRDGHLPEARLDEAAARTAALAGRDPQALTCRSVTLPSLG